MSSKRKTRMAVLVLDPLGLIYEGDGDVLRRHNEYGYHLKIYSTKNPISLIIFSINSSECIDMAPYKNIKVYSISKSSFSFIFLQRRAAKFIQEENFDIQLITTDAWHGFCSAFFLNYYLRIKTAIEIQLHGDIADPKWRHINMRNNLKFYLARISLLRATNIRLVNSFQTENLQKNFKLLDKFTIIPVPISLPSIGSHSQVKSERLRVIGFIGRIHQDRGIWEFIKLIKKLNIQTQDFKLIIAGDGPDKENFLSQLYEILPKSRITYLGHIPEKELRKVWKRVGVLVSLAPVESYGRVMREALVAGVPVWARSSSGVKDLMDKCEKGTVKIIDLNMSASDLSREFEVLLKTKVGPKFAKAFIKENDTYAEKLAQSWIKTINKSKKA